MKKRLTFSWMVGIVCVAAMLAGARSASALTIDSSEAFAKVKPGSPTSSTEDTAELNDILVNYNTTGTFTVDPTTWGNPGNYTITIYDDPGNDTVGNPIGGDTFSNGGTSFQLTLSGTETYLLVKWDNQDVFYDISALEAGTYTVTNDLVCQANSSPGDSNCSYQGVSGYKLWGGHTVPDGGSTVTLLGSALVALGMLRRRFSNN